VKDLVENRAGTVAFKRENARGHFVKYAAKGEEVAARVQFFSENLLGRHVQNRAQRGAGAGEMDRVRCQSGRSVANAADRFR